MQPHYQAESVYYAHGPSPDGRWEPLAEHLQRVARRAAGFAAAFGAENEARLVGLLHDLGKYGRLFQRRLRGEARGIDHWSAGAWAAFRYAKKNGVAAALAIQGHHIGLQQLTKNSIAAMEPGKLAQRHPLNLRPSEESVEPLLKRFREDGFTAPSLDTSLCHWGRTDHTALMLDVRMLFSCLVDADFVETEQHFAGTAGEQGARPTGESLKAEQAFSQLGKYLNRLRAESQASWAIRRVREDLLSACTEAAASPCGLFTLSAPTGAGKTLAMLAFALRHAMRNDLRRIIFVIPFLSIIDQTARAYREMLGDAFGDRYLIEDHSLAGGGAEGEPKAEQNLDSDNERLRAQRLLAENWDAPIIITTSVQLLESLFSNRPSSCRKLHRLARSVILFDEVQTIPTELAIPTLATLSRLSERYRTSILFSTATQPAFAHLDEAVREIGSAGWKQREIVPPSLGLFARSKRVRVKWPDPAVTVSWEEIRETISQRDQVLCIVNLRRHAAALASELEKTHPDGLHHLSTNMCPRHRERVLEEVKQRLKSGAPCRLISTQCVEAGVDVDFPVVYRAWGPLEAIAQAAGRCNREGRLPCGEVHVFFPEEAGYPPGTYKQAADVALAILKLRGRQDMDLADPALFEEYYRTFYDLISIGRPSTGRTAELMESIRAKDFAAVARQYRLIREDRINVLVPYDDQSYAPLADQARQRGINGAWLRKAREHAVAIFRPGRDDPWHEFLEPVALTPRFRSEDWFILRKEDLYDRNLLGLTLPEGSGRPLII